MAAVGFFACGGDSEFVDPLSRLSLSRSYACAVLQILAGRTKKSLTAYVYVVLALVAGRVAANGQSGASTCKDVCRLVDQICSLISNRRFTIGRANEAALVRVCKCV
jgi:hypothetical protein